MIDESPESRSNTQQDVKRRLHAQATEYGKRHEINLQVFKVRSRKLSTSPWGRKWNHNLQNFEFYQGRLAMGRKICRLEGLFNLTLRENELEAFVVTLEGSYECNLQFQPLDPEQVEILQQVCLQELSNLSDLLTGKISDDLMNKIVATPHLLPEPQQIKVICNCLDYADLCEHAAGILYAFGQHLDDHPEDFFKLRGLDLSQMIRHQYHDKLKEKETTMTKDDMSQLFDIQLI